MSADVLFRRFPDFTTKGQKSKVKASVVSTHSLARHAEQMGLGDHLLLGRGEEKTGGRFKRALLADAYEALIAAIYLDGGCDAATASLQRELHEAIDLGVANDRRPGLQISAAGAPAGARASAAPNAGLPAQSADHPQGCSAWKSWCTAKCWAPRAATRRRKPNRKRRGSRFS